MINNAYAEFAWEKASELLAIDSPSGFTASAAAWVKNAFEELGFSTRGESGIVASSLSLR